MTWIFRTGAPVLLAGLLVAGVALSQKVRERVRPVAQLEAQPIPGGSGVLWYDQTKWKLEPRPEDATVIFLYREGLGQMRLIRREGAATAGEQIERLTDSIREISPQVSVSKREPQLVNGVEMTLVEISVYPENNPPLVYYGLMYSGDEETVQLIGVTGMSLMADFRADFDLLLDGLVVEPADEEEAAP